MESAATTYISNLWPFPLVWEWIEVVFPEATLTSSSHSRWELGGGGGGGVDKAGSSHLNGSKYWCEAEGWWFPVNPAHIPCRAPSLRYSLLILFIYDLSGYRTGTPFGNSKSKCVGQFAEVCPLAAEQGELLGAEKGQDTGSVYLKRSKCVCCGMESLLFWCWLNGDWNPNAQGGRPFLRSWPCCIHKYSWDQNQALSMN